MKPKILITDDSSINQMILTDILGTEYTYLYASDGVQALEILEQTADIDLLLLDIFMPKRDGFGVLETMQRWGWTEELPVIIISSEDNSDFIRRAYDLGATDYIRRPFNMTVVQRRVRNTLKLYSRQKQLVEMVERQVLEREQTNTTIVNILSHVIESRNNEPGGHLLHVRTLTELLLRALVKKTDAYNLKEADIARITTLSALHDIGKLGVPLNVLNKPGKLDAEEWEIMKGHCVIGDALLRDVPIGRNNLILRTAREIARWHHERWDGCGYPDGLFGEEIPISAQVVAVADAYDALTSDRVYKNAFAHETALAMILRGECGAFNPLLLECLQEVAPKMNTAKQTPGELYDFHSEAKRLTTELMGQQALPENTRIHRQMNVLKEKSNFFQQQHGGIQFEYDRWLDKVTFINWNEPEQKRWQTLFLKQGENMQLLTSEDWQRLRRMIQSTTRDAPQVEAEMLVPVNGVWRWHRVTARTIWSNKNATYSGVVGQFTDIHQEVLNRAMGKLEVMEANSRQLIRILGQMRRVFDVVRLVDPVTNWVLTFQENGGLVSTRECCYRIWGRDGACGNCSSLRAFNENGWVSKLEMKDGTMYCVLSRAQLLAGRQCVLEVAMRLDDRTIPGIDAPSPGANLMSFYKDSVTQAYSRLYMDSFLPTLEEAEAVAFMDIDHFKQINDQYGHHIGDIALKAIAETIAQHVRDEDRFIRYGGDEFVLVCKQIPEAEFLECLTQIHGAVRAITIPNVPGLRIDLSYGYAYRIFPLSEAIHQADLKMYEMKSEKRRREVNDLTGVLFSSGL